MNCFRRAMGNQASSSSSPPPRRQPLRKFFKNTGTLGLSKAELEKRCQPSGLYPSCKWEDKAIRKLIGDGKIAARLKGEEVRQGNDDHECPICFLNYTTVNTTKCCQASICTECYLQVRPQKEKSSACPFCNHNKLSVSVLVMDEAAIAIREKEEQRLIEAKIKADSAIKCNLTDNTHEDADCPEASELPASSSTFGTNLEKNERVAQLRARSSSYASDPEGDACSISALAMTPDERRELEDEMKAQQLHPLSLRLEQEEAERRLENEQVFRRTQSGRLEALRERRELLRQTLSNNSIRSQNDHDWNRIIQSMEATSRTPSQSMNDLVVMEAALMLSREEARNSTVPQNFQSLGSDAGLNVASLMLSEDEQIRRAIEASLQDNISTDATSRDNETDRDSVAETSPVSNSSSSNGNGSSPLPS